MLPSAGIEPNSLLEPQRFIIKVEATTNSPPGISMAPSSSFSDIDKPSTIAAGVANYMAFGSVSSGATSVARKHTTSRVVPQWHASVVKKHTTSRVVPQWHAIVARKHTTSRVVPQVWRGNTPLVLLILRFAEPSIPAAIVFRLISRLHIMPPCKFGHDGLKTLRFRCDFSSTVLDVLKSRGWLQSYGAHSYPEDKVLAWLQVSWLLFTHYQSYVAHSYPGGKVLAWLQVYWLIFTHYQSYGAHSYPEDKVLAWLQVSWLFFTHYQSYVAHSYPGGKVLAWLQVYWLIFTHYQSYVAHSYPEDKVLAWLQVEGEDESWNLFWCEVTKLRTTLDNKRLEGNQRVPHFRNHYELTRKNLLAKNLKRLRRQCVKEGCREDADMCDCMPVTYELPPGTKGSGPAHKAIGKIPPTILCDVEDYSKVVRAIQSKVREPVEVVRQPGDGVRLQCGLEEAYRTLQKFLPSLGIQHWSYELGRERLVSVMVKGFLTQEGRTDGLREGQKPSRHVAVRKVIVTPAPTPKPLVKSFASALSGRPTPQLPKPSFHNQSRLVLSFYSRTSPRPLLSPSQPILSLPSSPLHAHSHAPLQLISSTLHPYTYHHPTPPTPYTHPRG
uniref:Uncharacterized protein n=1 Tax=Timema tahoe TaxID=61484 RepID=A0A7R9ILG9_9NEOP|nr:unnamed protein product [Timema tahoe]